MTEKRYSDGSLAKWYYSRDYGGMRVISNGFDEFVLNSKKQFKDIDSKELKGTTQLLDELNKLEDKIIILEKENKELKQINTLCNERYRELADENEGLKQALLFFLDVANTECSSSFEKDMEHDCQKLFNCSYNEAKKKYGGYNGT